MQSAPKVELSSSKSSNRIALTSCFFAMSFCALSDVLSKSITPFIFSAITVPPGLIAFVTEEIMDVVSLI